MSGNFAIKGGGGRTPNGKCHLKFPFWFSAHLPNFQTFFCPTSTMPSNIIEDKDKDKLDKECTSTASIMTNFGALGGGISLYSNCQNFNYIKVKKLWINLNLCAFTRASLFVQRGDMYSCRCIYDRRSTYCEQSGALSQLTHWRR